jgi:hypothetical protein
MSSNMQLVENKDNYPQFKSGRRSLREEYAAAAQGEPPQQATNDPMALFNDSQLVESQAQAATRTLATLLGGTPEMGPEKNWFRVQAKFSGKNGKDASYNCDFSRSRILLRNKAQAREAMNIFTGPGTIQLKDGTILKVREVENNLATFNEKKKGLPNLDVKLTFEFTGPDGEPTFHHHELHFIFAKARADYERSHDAYKAKRVAEIYRDGADNALSVCGTKEDARSWGQKWNQFNNEVEAAQKLRLSIHNKIREDLGLNELLGYQPCVSSKAKKLANPGGMLYVIQ